MKKLTYAFIACFALAAAPASAANINVSATIDLYPTIKYLSPLDHPVTLNVGDTVTYNVTFADNKAFQINGTNGPNNDFVSFWMAAASGTSADWTINNVSVQLHGFQTNAGIANPLTVAGQVPGGNIAIGPNFYFQDLDAGEYLSFSGFSVSFVITSLVKANTNIATSNVVYDRAWFVSSPNHSVSDAPSAVPLPAALPLFASGLGLMGLATWRRKRKAPKAAA